jgi:hypothetical protein
MKHTISNWLHRFAEAAEKAIAAEILCQDFKTDQAKADFVRFLLGDMANLSSKDRPFIWESVYENPEADQQVTFTHTDMLTLLIILHREFFRAD